MRRGGGQIETYDVISSGVFSLRSGLFCLEYNKPGLYVFLVGEHVPLHSNGILLHPDTMRECEMVIACPVIVRCLEDCARSTKTVVCKAWPLPKLSLDGG